MKQYITPLVAFFFASLAGAVYFFGVVQIQSAIDRIGTATADAEVLSNKDVALQSARAFLNEVGSLNADLAQFVVLEKNVVQVIELLEDIARDERVTLSIGNVALSGVDAWRSHELINLTFSVEGTFVRMTSFLNTLELLPRAVRLENGTLEKSGRNAWFGTFTVTFVKEKL